MSPEAVVWTGMAAVAAWRTLVLLRPTSRTRARIVVAALLCAHVFALSFLLEPVVAALDAVVPGLPRLLLNVLLIVVMGGFLLFFGASPTAPPHRVLRPRVQGALAVTTAVLLVVTWATDPAELTGRELAPVGGTHPGPYLFDLVACLYLGWAGLALAYHAASEASRAAGRWRHGLWTSATGLALTGLVCLVVRGPLTVVFWIGTGPLFLDRVSMLLLLLAVVVVDLGLCLVAGGAALSQLRLWWRAKRETRTLRPLWEELHAVFPQLALHPPHGRVREALALRWVAYSHRRRIAECRDGLWLLSGHAGPGTGPATVRAALDAARRDAEAGGPPRPLLDPDSDRALLELARALRHQPSHCDPPRVRLSPTTRTGT